MSHGSLVRAQEPALDQTGDAVRARQQVIADDRATNRIEACIHLEGPNARVLAPTIQRLANYDSHTGTAATRRQCDC